MVEALLIVFGSVGGFAIGFVAATALCYREIHRDYLDRFEENRDE